MDITVLGIDLAKNSMQLHGVNAHGRVILKKSISRGKLAEFIANLPPCLIGMEACGGANYWARKFQQFGHEVKLMHPKFIKPYVKSNKNDAHDAEAIGEALTRPNMRFVGIKTVEQQDMQSLHRIRSLLIKSRTATVNQIRGLLSEYGIVIPQQIQNVGACLPDILEDAENELTPITRELFDNLYQQLQNYDKQISFYDKKIEYIAKTDERCKKLTQIEGVGPITATIICTELANTKAFKNGREFASFLGLVPRQNSTGGKQNLLGISKRGDKYIRTLLIHGARSVVCRAPNKFDKRSLWINKIRETRGYNKACVALANKNARIIWAMLDKNEDYLKPTCLKAA